MKIKIIAGIQLAVIVVLMVLLTTEEQSHQSNITEYESRIKESQAQTAKALQDFDSLYKSFKTMEEANNKNQAAVAECLAILKH